MSTTTSPAPVTPPPRLGATPHVEEPNGEQPESRLAIGLRWAGDATSIVLLIAVLWWLAYHDGGWERTALAKVGLLAVIAVPAAAAELRRLPTTVRVSIALWAVGVVASLLFAAERSGFAQPTITYALVPVVGLSAYRIWRRRWGPPAVAALLLVSFGLYWYQAFMDWWGVATSRSAQPRWRPLSWHNQSGVLMVAFGLVFGGVALTGRRIVAVAFGLCAAAALAGAWLSGSRGTLAVLFVGAAVLLVVAFAARGALATTVRAFALTVAATAVVVGLLAFGGSQTGVPVDRTSSASGGAAEHHAFLRLLHMDAAIGMFTDAPLTGQGVGSYRRMARPFTSATANLTNSAHNEYVEVLGEGGLGMAVPFLVLSGAALFACWSRLRQARRGIAELPHEIVADDLRWPASAGAVGAVFALLLHQGIDFDWAFPVIPAVLAIGMAITGHDAMTGTITDRTRRTTTLAVATGMLLVLLLVAGSVGVLWQNRSAQLEPNPSADELAQTPAPWAVSGASAVAFDLMREGEYGHARRTLERAIAWNPGYRPLRVDLAVIEYSAGELSGRNLVEQLRGLNFGFSRYNQVAHALIEGGDHELARDVLAAVLETYPRYEAWGIDAARANSWYLLVRATGEAEGCDASNRTAAEARSNQGMDEPEELDRITDIVSSICQ